MIYLQTDSSDVYHEGLVDCTDTSDFDSSLVTPKPKWDQMESLAFKDEKSHKVYMLSYLVHYLQSRQISLLHLAFAERRDWAWISSSPIFYTNDSESLNSLLKESLGYKKHQWGHFNDKVKQVIEQTAAGDGESYN